MERSYPEQYEGKRRREDYGRSAEDTQNTRTKRFYKNNEGNENGRYKSKIGDKRVFKRTMK